MRFRGLAPVPCQQPAVCAAWTCAATTSPSRQTHGLIYWGDWFCFEVSSALRERECEAGCTTGDGHVLHCVGRPNDAGTAHRISFSL